ncbi:MAG: SRPBCC family protein [Steroidobacteraceae bacterium]
MLKIIGIVIVVAIALLLIYASTRPDSFHVERSTRIKATPDKIFALINDLHQWEAWSPYAKLDPNMKTRYSGAASGTGAMYEWDGNSQVGSGKVTIADSTPVSRVAIKLDMFKPFEGHNDVVFTLQSEGDSTTVTWAMDGASAFITKVMSVFFSMDKMVGGQFEEGLASLKGLAEK